MNYRQICRYVEINEVHTHTVYRIPYTVAKNEKYHVFFNFFSNHYCTKLQLLPTKLGIHNPPKTCLERDPRRAAFKKKITTQNISAQMSRFAVIFGFCTILPATQELITSRGEHRGLNLIIMSLNHPPPHWVSRFSITPLNSSSKWS